MQTYTKMRSRKFPDVIMKVIPGHFVTPNSHINYYIDMTTMRTRQSEAKAAARAMASTYAATTIVDTIVCMDGMEVIGAYLAEELDSALPPEAPVLIVLEQDMAKALGILIEKALQGRRKLACIDGIQVEENDYVDMGRPLLNGLVIPVVIKTLLFG